MSVNPYESPKEQGTLAPRDHPFLRSIVRGFTLLLGIICGTTLATLAMTLSLTLAFVGVLRIFASLGMSEGLFLGGATVFSIILGAFMTFFVHIKIANLLFRVFKIQEPTAPHMLTVEAIRRS